MTFNIKPLKSTDYEEVLIDWWKDWGWTPPVKDFLPDNGKGGIMVYDKDIPVCAGFVYNTNSKVAWVDWIISNRNYRKTPERKDAINLLIETLTNVCKNLGNKYSYALIKHDRLIKCYEKVGYEKGDVYNKEMIKVL
ncbi:MAG: hypothetical protein Unbinned1524contig1000_55 [Prokaryotic dsDNA virus sp.]|nr:MAG: hypothetical protein Unbinned1524contig1000_55 [Prokaryotic dsDNA virus sp.]|tara:strand:- start:3838 stop:4248 length:411 start_codon:yes stop_codon:yes gene_type:complete